MNGQINNKMKTIKTPSVVSRKPFEEREEQSHENQNEVTKVNEARERLREMSKQVKSLVKEGKFESINQAILATFYEPNGTTELKTFDQWRAEGFSVKKGEKSLLLWGKPREHTEKHMEGQTLEHDDDDMPPYYPVCHLFSREQVEELKQNRDKNNLDELKEIRGKGEELEHDIEME